MKLAEALILRADAQKRIEQMRQRLARSAQVQEDEQPPEDPQELMDETRRTVQEYQTLIQQINRTNAATAFDDTRTLTDALAQRDALMLERGILSGMIQAATQAQYRYGRSEIKYVATIDVAQTQRQMDDLARQYRELDSAIQQLNWTVDLIET